MPAVVRDRHAGVSVGLLKFLRIVALANTIDQNGVLHKESFHVPGLSLCESCHDDRMLGLRTGQMVHPGDY